jgi:SAM-dependent methyltransferase
MMLHRTVPLSDEWGIDRGTPIDRHFIEAFLAANRQDIRGRVLEVKDGTYTQQFGSAVVSCDVLDIDPSNPHATICADLAKASAIPADQFDCFILTQTLQYIYDVRAALTHAQRILRPGGVLLATVPAVVRIDSALAHTDYWRFTVPSCKAMFGSVFGAERSSVSAYGNFVTAMAFLRGAAAEELSVRSFDEQDDRFPVVIAARSVKS